MGIVADTVRAVSKALFQDRSDRVRLTVSGPDRAKFLHNLTTNEVKRLPVGQGVEAFVTSPQGKTIGYVSLLAGTTSVTVRTDPGGAEHVLPHFQKYGVFDDVLIEDVGAETFEYHVAGSHAEAILSQAGAEIPEAGDLKHHATTVGGKAVLLVREAPLGEPGLTVVGERADAEAVSQAIHEAGAEYGLIDLDAATAEAMRIEAGTPAFGRDVKPDNLPQEVARDGRAINFVKGCYLGQETVARIDALGHVNKLLRGLKLATGDSAVPPAGSTIEADGKNVGTVTSSSFSTRMGCPVALGYVRTSHTPNGTTVTVVSGGSKWQAVVSDLPLQSS